MKPIAIKLLAALGVVYLAFVVYFFVMAKKSGDEHRAKTIDANIPGITAAFREKFGKAVSHDQAKEIAEMVFEEKGEVVSLTTYNTVMNVLNFLALMLLLYGFLWDPMTKFLDERREKIRGDLESAKTTREKAQKVLADYNRKLREADDEKRAIIREGKAQSQKERERILGEARAEADRSLENASAAIAAEEAKARDRLRDELADISVALSRKVLEREIAGKDHERVIGEFVNKLGARS